MKRASRESFRGEAIEGERPRSPTEGRGSAPEIAATLFEPFATGKQDGVGLGLALTKKIVDDHGGKIGFETSERGTTFWMELPT